MANQTQHYVNGKYPLLETEYRERPVRRKFSKAYKRQIVKEAGACGYGETGALLRREGLYSSQLTEWRRQAAKGELTEHSAVQSGAQGKTKKAEITTLQEENARLTRKLEQAELIIAAQKKLALALEQTLREPKDKS